MRDHLDRLTRRWMNKCPSKGEYSFRDKMELNRMEKEMNKYMELILTQTVLVHTGQ